MLWAAGLQRADGAGEATRNEESLIDAECVEFSVACVWIWSRQHETGHVDVYPCVVKTSVVRLVW